MWCWRDSIFKTRNEFSPQKSFSTRKKYSFQQQLIFFIFLVMELWDCRHLLFFFAFVDISIRLFATDLSLLIRFSVIAVKQKEVVTLTSVRYSCKTSKASKTRTCYDPVSHINNWKKLTPDGGQRLQRINTGWENHHPSKTPFNGCKYIIITYMWTAVEEMIMKAILAVMNTT